MKKSIVLLFVILAAIQPVLLGQTAFSYDLELKPVTIPDLPGLHSYAHAQHEGQYLIVGGRLDGLHARQPFRSFPANQNNTDIYVVTPKTKTVSKVSILNSSPNIAEQLQSTNMNYYQDEEILYIVGGYGYSEQEGDHITFPFLAAIQVPQIIEAIEQNRDIAPYIQQIEHQQMAVTGGHLGKLEDTFYLIGGHRFDGRYNPMNMPSFVQEYTDAIRRFEMEWSPEQLQLNVINEVKDPIHLHRRDYNLLNRLLPDGERAFVISSGVFQRQVDLPFLYPVEIYSDDYFPRTDFNQYLSNYHSANVALYDSATQHMEYLFFGGMAQYYYEDGVMVEDDQVPFVNTISRISLSPQGDFTEYVLDQKMPGLEGASSEFLINSDLSESPSNILTFNSQGSDTLDLGYIYGGIYSRSRNPFMQNNTESTEARDVMYHVRLIPRSTSGIPQRRVDRENPFQMKVFPNPTSDVFTLHLEGPTFQEAHYFISTPDGRWIDRGTLRPAELTEGKIQFAIDASVGANTLFITIVLDNTYYLNEKLVLNP
jgi:hypothetical protein